MPARRGGGPRWGPPPLRPRPYTPSHRAARLPRRSLAPHLPKCRLPLPSQRLGRLGVGAFFGGGLGALLHVGQGLGHHLGVGVHQAAGGQATGRGPGIGGNSQRRKPNVSAPGRQVRSCVRSGEYATWNGTSSRGWGRCGCHRTRSAPPPGGFSLACRWGAEAPPCRCSGRDGPRTALAVAQDRPRCARPDGGGRSSWHGEAIRV